MCYLNKIASIVQKIIKPAINVKLFFVSAVVNIRPIVYANFVMILIIKLYD